MRLAGTYSYEVAVAVPATYSYGGGGTFPPSVIDAAEANHELPMGANPSHTIPSANSNCVQFFRVNASVGYPHPGNGVLIDPPRLVRITQTGAPPGVQLQYILATSSDAPSVDVKYEKPTVTVEVDPNFFHGWGFHRDRLVPASQLFRWNASAGTGTRQHTRRVQQQQALLIPAGP